MPRRTPEQQIADLEARLALAKDRARRARTHRLIVFAGHFASALDDWDTLPPAAQDSIRAKVCEGIRQAAHRPPPAPLHQPAGNVGGSDGTLRPPA